MNRERKNRVCIFGLSGDPPTGTLGHQGIVQLLVNLQYYSEIWVLPVYVHAYKTLSKTKLAPFEHRLKMCRLAFEKIDDTVHVKATEQDVFLQHCHKTEVVGTAELLDFLTTKHPEFTFSLALGSDTYRDLVQGKWCCRESDISRAVFVFEVFARGDDFLETEQIVLAENEKAAAQRQQTKFTGTDSKATPSFDTKLHRLPHDARYNQLVSSTLVRTELLELGASCSKEFSKAPAVESSSPLFSPAVIDPSVLAYAITHQLYGNPSFANNMLLWMNIGVAPFMILSRIASLIGDLIPLLVLLLLGLGLTARTWFRTFHRWPLRFFTNVG